MIHRVLRAVQALASEPTEPARNAEHDVEVEQLQAEVRALRDERDLARQHKDDLFDLVVRMERQRDEWRARFMEQWHQHQNAQALLEQHIHSVGTTLVRTAELLNDARKAANLEPVSLAGLKRLGEQGARALRSSQEYGDAMRALEESGAKRDRAGNVLGWDGKREPDLDGDAERKRVVDPR